ncbi:Hypothetical protein, partial CDS, partial [Neorhizobium galegae bv. orientalis]
MAGRNGMINDNSHRCHAAQCVDHRKTPAPPVHLAPLCCDRS